MVNMAWLLDPILAGYNDRHESVSECSSAAFGGLSDCNRLRAAASCRVRSLSLGFSRSRSGWANHRANSSMPGRPRWGILRTMFKQPRPLEKGGRLAIIAPGGPIQEEARFHAGVKRLRSRYHVVYSPSLFAHLGYLAGDDQRRSQELIEALEDPAIDAILAARGGYGSMRVLDTVGIERVRQANKLIIGFSDITALHALWAHARLQSVHAPMVCTLAELEEADWQQWISVVENTEQSPAGYHNLTAWTQGQATGPLLGGNLSSMHALLATPYAMPCKGAILFIEDISEAPYRIDRMLSTLRLAGVFEDLAGVLVGSFTDSDPGLHTTTVQEVLFEHLSALPLPVLAGLPAGHGPSNLPLRLGMPITLDTATGSITGTSRR